MSASPPCTSWYGLRRCSKSRVSTHGHVAAISRNLPCLRSHPRAPTRVHAPCPCSSTCDDRQKSDACPSSSALVPLWSLPDLCSCDSSSYCCSSACRLDLGPSHGATRTCDAGPSGDCPLSMTESSCCYCHRVVLPVVDRGTLLLEVVLQDESLTSRGRVGGEEVEQAQGRKRMKVEVV